VNLAVLNLLVCDLTAAKTAVTAVVPVTRTFAGDGSAKSGGVLKKASRLAMAGTSGDAGALELWVL